MNTIGIFLVTYILSLIYRTFNYGMVISFEVGGITLLLTDILSFFLIITLLFRYDKYPNIIKKELFWYIKVIYILVLIGSIIGFLRGNVVATVFADFRIFLGFFTGCILGASYIRNYRKSYLYLTIISYFLCVLFFLYSFKLVVDITLKYAGIGLLRATDPFLFELAGYLLLLLPLITILSIYNKRRLLFYLNIIAICFYITFMAIIATTKSISSAAIIGLVLCIIVILNKNQGTSKKILLVLKSSLAGIILLILVKNVFYDFLPINLFFHSAAYRWTVLQESSIHARIFDLMSMIDTIDAGGWVIGQGLGSVFATVAAEEGVMALSPHISIFTPLLKFGIVGFIVLSVWPFYYIIKNWSKFLRTINTIPVSRNMIANLTSLVVFLVIYSMSGGWNYGIMIIVGFNVFIVTVEKRKKIYGTYA